MLLEQLVESRVAPIRALYTPVRLSQALFDPCRPSFANFAAVPSNVDAIEAVLAFTSGHRPFVVLVGPCGWGKSHLMQAAASELSQQQGLPVHVSSIAECLDTRSKLDSPAILIIDDAQDGLQTTRLKQQFRLLLERRVRAGRPTLVAFGDERYSSASKAFLPFPREWCIATLEEPSSAERELILRQMLHGEDLVLAPALIKLLASKAVDNGRSLIGALRKLKLIQKSWLEPHEVLQAAGIVKAYFGSSDGWDLRDHVLETLSDWLGKSESTLPVDVTQNDLAIYLLLQTIGLSEREVAAYFRVKPGTAYNRAMRIQHKYQDGSLNELIKLCQNALCLSFERL